MIHTFFSIMLVVLLLVFLGGMVLRIETLSQELAKLSWDVSLLKVRLKETDDKIRISKDGINNDRT